MVLAALFIAARGAPKDGIDGIDIDGIEKSDFFSSLPSLSGSETAEIAREGCVGTARPFTKRFSAMAASFAKNSARRVSRLARSYASSASSSARRAEAGSGVGSAYRSYPQRPRRPSSFEKPPVSRREAEGEDASYLRADIDIVSPPEKEEGEATFVIPRWYPTRRGDATRRSSRSRTRRSSSSRRERAPRSASSVALCRRSDAASASPGVEGTASFSFSLPPSPRATPSNKRFGGGATNTFFLLNRRCCGVGENGGMAEGE